MHIYSCIRDAVILYADCIYSLYVMYVDTVEMRRETLVGR